MLYKVDSSSKVENVWLKELLKKNNFNSLLKRYFYVTYHLLIFFLVDESNEHSLQHKIGIYMFFV